MHNFGLFSVEDLLLFVPEIELNGNNFPDFVVIVVVVVVLKNVPNHIDLCEYPEAN